MMGEDVGRKGYSTVPWGIYRGQDCPDTTGIINLGKKSNLFCFATRGKGAVPSTLEGFGFCEEGSPDVKRKAEDGIVSRWILVTFAPKNLCIPATFPRL